MTITKFRNCNATIVNPGNGIKVFLSYQTPVAAFLPSAGYFRTNKRYSVTTSRQIGQWLEEEGAANVEERDPEFFANLLK